MSGDHTANVRISGAFREAEMGVKIDGVWRFAAPVVAGSFDDGFDTFGLIGNESFNPNAPTLKDGTSMGSGAGSMRYYYEAAMAPFLSSAIAEDHVAIETVFRNENVYQMARRAGSQLERYLSAFRLTGDLRILDRFIEGFELHKAKLIVAWPLSHWDPCLMTTRSRETQCGISGSGCGADGVGNPWSPFPKLVHRSQSNYSGGTDINQNERVKMNWAWTLWAWALHQNRGKVSPAYGATRYAEEADYWGAHAEDIVFTYSATNAMIASRFAGTDWASACWAQNYLGRSSRVYDSDWSSGFRRQEWGKWPILAMHGAHKPLNTVMMQRYLGALGKFGSYGGAPLNIPNPDDAVVASRMMADYIVNTYVPCVDRNGRPNLIVRGNISPGGARNNAAVRNTYSGSVANTMIHQWMSGGYRDIYNRETMLRVSRAYADMMNTDGSAKRNLTGEVDRCGHGLYVMDAPSKELRDQRDNRRSGYSNMLIFANESEPSGTHLWTSAVNAQASEGYVTPAQGSLPAGMFIRRALEAVGDI